LLISYQSTALSVVYVLSFVASQSAKRKADLVVLKRCGRLSDCEHRAEPILAHRAREFCAEHIEASVSLNTKLAALTVMIHTEATSCFLWFATIQGIEPYPYLRKCSA
jgi:hypothetical protein